MSYFMSVTSRAIQLPPFNPWQWHKEKAKDYTGIHKLMNYLLRRLEQLNYRKRDDRVQEEKKTADGKRTGFWMDAGSILEFVLKESVLVMCLRNTCRWRLLKLRLESDTYHCLALCLLLLC